MPTLFFEDDELPAELQARLGIEPGAAPAPAVDIRALLDRLTVSALARARLGQLAPPAPFRSPREVAAPAPAPGG